MTTISVNGERISFLGVKDCASLGVVSQAIPTLKRNILSMEQDEIEQLRQAELLEEIEGYDEEKLEGENFSEAYKK